MEPGTWRQNSPALLEKERWDMQRKRELGRNEEAVKTANLEKQLIFYRRTQGTTMNFGSLEKVIEWEGDF